MGWQRDDLFYVALALAIAAVCFGGFSFTYFAPIALGTYPPAKLPLHFHGWSFFLWYLLLPAQAILMAAGRRKMHATLGRLSLALVCIMVATGMLVLSVRVEEALRTGGQRVWILYGPLILSNLLLFLVFYGAGIRMALTGRIQAHKRLLIVASAIGLGAGFFRLVLFLSGFHPLSLPVGVLACGLFIVIGIGYDWLTRRRVHRVYVVGLIAMVAVEIPLLPQVNPGGVAHVTRLIGKLGESLKVLYTPEPTVEFSDG